MCASWWADATGLVKAITGLLVAIPPVVAAVYGLVAVFSPKVGGNPRDAAVGGAADPGAPPPGEKYHAERDHWDQIVEP